MKEKFSSTEHLTRLEQSGTSEASEKTLKALKAANQLYLNKFGFRLVLIEALNNAVIHGHESEKGRKVQLNVKVSGTDLLLEITNQGSGFNWQEALERSKQKEQNDPFSEGGRGFMIYNLYGYVFSFEDGGRKLNLNKVLDD